MLGGMDSLEAWERGFLVFMCDAAVAMLRVAKPGAHALVWAIPRTSDLTGMAMRLAGWEVRDKVAHVFGSGFPKSLDVSKAIDKAAGAEREVVEKSPNWRPAKTHGGAGFDKLGCGEANINITAPATEAARQWDGWGTALKPAMEDWWLCRKPLGESTVAANVLRYGTGALNIGACRVGTDAGWSYPNGRGGSGWHGKESLSTNLTEPMAATAGRWPANVILSYPSDLYELRDDVTTDQLRALVEHLVNRGRVEAAREVVGGFPETGNSCGRDSRGRVHQAFTDDARKSTRDDVHPGFGDSGSSARFFKNCPPDALSELPPDLQALFVLCPNPGKEEVVGGFPETGPGASPAKSNSEPGGSGRTMGTGWYAPDSGVRIEFDSGSAARFFYCAKSSPDERRLDGCESIMIQCRVSSTQGDSQWEDVEMVVRLRVDTGRSQPKVIAVSGAQKHDVTEWNTFLFGNSTTGQSLMGTASIIATGTSSTIKSKTLKSLRRSITSECTADAICATASGGSPAVNAELGTLSLITTSTWLASVLGVESAALPMQLRISASEGKTAHPTVKPLELIQYLIRLVTPPGGTVLDPFLGSGTTAAAAHRQNFRCIGIEREAEYFADCIERMERELDRHPLFDRPNKQQRELI